MCNCSFSPESSQWCWYFSVMAHRNWHNNQASVYGPTGNKWYSNIFSQNPMKRDSWNWWWLCFASLNLCFLLLLCFMQIITINGMFPGPLINAPANDNIHVNVFNDMDESLLITWYISLTLSFSGLLHNWFSLNSAKKIFLF